MRYMNRHRTDNLKPYRNTYRFQPNWINKQEYKQNSFNIRSDHTQRHKWVRTFRRFNDYMRGTKSGRSFFDKPQYNKGGGYYNNKAQTNRNGNDRRHNNNSVKYQKLDNDKKQRIYDDYDYRPNQHKNRYSSTKSSSSSSSTTSTYITSTTNIPVVVSSTKQFIDEDVSDWDVHHHTTTTSHRYNSTKKYNDNNKSNVSNRKRTHTSRSFSVQSDIVC